MDVPAFDPEEEGAICRFNLAFALRTGEDSEFLKALSDLWTIALHRLRVKNGLASATGVPVLFSTEEAVDTLRAVCAADGNVRRALYQEPFGFAPDGAIEQSFALVFGDAVYARWREAFENEQFDRCLALTERPDQP